MKMTTMITGKNLIEGQWEGSPEALAAPALDGVEVAQADASQADRAAQAARAAFRPYSQISRGERAAFLRAIAEEIEAAGAEITRIGAAETGLPEARLEGERARTIGQLRMFADLITETGYLDIRHTPVLPDRAPLPRPDLRLIHKAIGPVVVFGASNFPLAFSTAGGDTASALAAGCSVIVKAHPAHPGTAELVALAIERAIARCDMPRATFQMLHGAGPAIGAALVIHPQIDAVGFTGSLGGGRALFDLCHQRPRPIPFFGEMGSINPVFCLPDAMAARAAQIGAGWVASLAMGAGQFCTNPGVIIGVAGEAFDTLRTTALDALSQAEPQEMLTGAIRAAYVAGIDEIAGLAEPLCRPAQPEEARLALPAAFRVDAGDWLANPGLHREVFGAFGIFVECASVEEMYAVAEALEGQLTVTLMLEERDVSLARELLPVLDEKAGRILCNGYPTGVEVCAAMMHGGPYPASTDIRSTSVGTLAITRWLRPVSYQNLPAALLPDELCEKEDEEG